MKKRRYVKRKRAQQEERTRQRIVQAAMALHEELGPRETTISAVAERAGVQRLTVYRHFADDFALFEACTSCWLEANPPPEASEWKGKGQAGDRTRRALLAIYRYYRRTAPMWSAVCRDLELVPALQGPMGRFERYLDEVRNDLVEAWGGSGAVIRRRRALLRHLLSFRTWQSLGGLGLQDPEMSRLGTLWVEAIAKHMGR